MASIKGRYEYPDGLTPGQSKDGGLHQNLYDSQGHLVDHGTFFPDDENEADSDTNPPPVFIYVTSEDASDSRANEPSELEELLGVLVLIFGAIKAAEKAAPYVKRWWNDQALPAIKSTRNRLARTRAADSQATSAELSAFDAPPESSHEVIAAFDEYSASMSSAEAMERFVAALMARRLSEDARLFSEEQMRILRNARIEDLELTNALETLSPKQVGDIIKLMLETSPATLDELGKILGRSPVYGGYAPLSREKIKEALPLTDAETQPIPRSLV
jgi:hypothetical protein